MFKSTVRDNNREGTAGETLTARRAATGLQEEKVFQGVIELKLATLLRLAALGVLLSGQLAAGRPLQSPPVAAASDIKPQVTYDVRLAGGSGRCAGRLEVLLGGQWGTVCNQGFDVIDAGTVCRQLGCGITGRVASFGPGTGPILLSGMACRGSETHLFQCGRSRSVAASCAHSADVGIQCR